MYKRPVVSIIAVNRTHPAQNFIKKTIHHFPSAELIIVRNQKDKNFTEAANAGALKARGEFLCFLQGFPPQRKWLESLLQFVKKTGVGAVQSRTKDGICILIPRVVMSHIGSFDEQFSFETACLDYALRLRSKSYRWISKEPLSINLDSLNHSSKKLLIKKWERLLSKQFLNTHALLRSTKNKFSQPLIKPDEIFNTNRYLRTGMAIRSPENNQQIQALVRFSDLEMFAPDALGQKIWKELNGSGDTAQLPSSQKKRHIETLMREGLIVRKRSVQNVRPVVTVMMAAHNAQLWIAEAIESVLAQTFRRFELIIVDDGSTDSTAQIARSYTKHPQVVFFQNERQVGISATRNRILSLARGKCIAVCDADDVMCSNLLERFVGVMRSNSKIGWVYGDLLTIDALGHRMNILPALPMDGCREFQRNVVNHCGALIRRDALLKIGGYDEMLTSSDDYDLALRMSKNFKIFALSGEIHYLWRRHSGSNSENDSPNPWAKYEFHQVIARGMNSGAFV